MTSFDYKPHFFWRLLMAHNPAQIMQLELHPGPHCDLYFCTYCFGHGQRPNRGHLLSVFEYEQIAKTLGELRPTIIISGVATEPLTHPDPSGIISAFRRRAYPLGLYTKGHRMDEAVRDALVDGTGECFVTVSIDAADAEEYDHVHNIATSAGKVSKRPHFDTVLENLSALARLKKRHKTDLKLRASFLVFRSLARSGRLANAIRQVEDHVDIIRIAIAQDRNDGTRSQFLPGNRQALLERLSSEFATHPKVVVLRDTYQPHRSDRFNRCVAQRIQATIDKSGNVFPCPQVALAPYKHLIMGSVRETPLPGILISQRRLSMFDCDVDSELRCRICDRKDEAINSAVVGHEIAFDGPSSET